MDLTTFAVCFLSLVCRSKETKVESNAPHKITVLHVHTNFEQWKWHKTVQKQTKGTERHTYTADTQTQQKALSRRNTQTVKHIQTNTLNHTQNPEMHTAKLHYKLRKQETGRKRTKHKLLNAMHFFHARRHTPGTTTTCRAADKNWLPIVTTAFACDFSSCEKAFLPPASFPHLSGFTKTETQIFTTIAVWHSITQK